MILDQTDEYLALTEEQKNVIDQDLALANADGQSDYEYYVENIGRGYLASYANVLLTVARKNAK